MLERFTKEARGAVTTAQELAARSRADHVGADHLLQGVAAGGGVAARLLSQAGATEEAIGEALARLDDARLLGTLGIDVDEVRASVERTFGPGAWTGTDPSSAGSARGGRVPFSAEAKKALELSLREAIALKSKTIEGGHLLLGILRTGGRAVEALKMVGADPSALRSRLQEAMPRAS